MINSRAAQAEIAVDHGDISLMPAEGVGSVLQRVLQAEALLVCQHLMRGGLSNVKHHPPLEIVRFDEFRAHRPSPGGRRRDPPRPAGARLAAGFARHRRARPASPLVPPATVSRSPSASKLSFVGVLSVTTACRLVADIGRIKEMSTRYSTNTNPAER